MSAHEIEGARLAGGSAEQLGHGTAISLAVQHRRHSGPGSCTLARGCCAESGSNLVHPDVFRARTFGDTRHGLRSAAMSRTAAVYRGTGRSGCELTLGSQLRI